MPSPLILLIFALAGQNTAPAPGTPVAPSSFAANLIRKFQVKVEAYAVIHRQAEKGLRPLKPGSTAATIAHRRRELAEKIRRLRRNASAGDIFTPAIASEISRLTGAAATGRRGTRVRKSLTRAEPVRFKLAVNRTYPSNTPLQSVPPTLLQYLPELQPELEYRIVGDALILRDIDANLIVDFMPDAIPERSDAR